MTTIIAYRAIEHLKEAHLVLANLGELESKMRDSSGQRKIHNSTEFEPIVTALKEIGALDDLPETAQISFFGF